MIQIFIATYNEDGEKKTLSVPAYDVYAVHKKLQTIGISATKVALDPIATISYIFNKDFDYNNLTRLYKTLGKRIDLGKSITEGLQSSVDFLSDPKLRFAALYMSSQLIKGEKIYEAMVASGFNNVEAMIIKSSEASGKQSDAFIRLSEEIKRRSILNGSIKKIFMMPGVTMTFIYFGSFAAPYFFGINSEKNLKNLDINLDQFATYFKIAHFSHDHTLLYISACIIPLIALVFAFQKGVISEWLDKWPLWRNISVKNEMSNSFKIFSQLWDSGVTPANCAELSANSCLRTDAKSSFMQLKANLLLGQKIEVAVAKSKFPNFVIKGVTAAELGSGGSFPQGLSDMCDEASLDVESLVEVLKAKLMITSQVVGGIGVLFFVYMALGPMYLSVLRNL